MQNQNTKLHAKMALIIKSAKRRMFKSLREGAQYGEAVDQFREEIIQELTIAMPDDDESDSVEVTLPNGEKVDLIGDAADLAREGNKSNFAPVCTVLEAVYVLLHDPKTPSELFEKVAEFITDQSNQANDIYHEPFVLAAVLASVPPNELMSAVIAARDAEVSHAN